MTPFKRRDMPRSSVIFGDRAALNQRAKARALDLGFLCYSFSGYPID